MHTIPEISVPMPEWYNRLLSMEQAIVKAIGAQYKIFTLIGIKYYDSGIEVQIRRTKCEHCHLLAIYTLWFDREGSNFVCRGYREGN